MNKKNIITLLIVIIITAFGFLLVRYCLDSLNFGKYILLKNEVNESAWVDVNSLNLGATGFNVVRYSKHIKNFKKLREVTVECNEKSDLSIFSGMDSLETLVIVYPPKLDQSDVQIIDLSGLRMSDNIETLMILNLSHIDLSFDSTEHFSCLKNLFVYCDYATIKGGCKSLTLLHP